MADTPRIDGPTGDHREDFGGRKRSAGGEPGSREEPVRRTRRQARARGALSSWGRSRPEASRSRREARIGAGAGAQPLRWGRPVRFLLGGATPVGVGAGRGRVSGGANCCKCRVHLEVNGVRVVIGECHARLRVVVFPGALNPISWWPVVADGDWCAEWSRRR